MKQSRSHRAQSRTVPTVEQPTVLYPVISHANEWKLSAEAIRGLEAVGGVEFKSDAAKALGRIAAAWVAHDRVLRSPRPKKFRGRFRRAGKALERAIKLLDFNEGDAVDQQLHHWLINSAFRGTPDLLQVSACVIEQGNQLIELLNHASKALPADSGRRRPGDEERFIIYLADQFEGSGGRARAYANKHRDSGYADTSFRKFVHQFYALLPIASRRTSSGLDEAIIRALRYRRRH
jgi:hypothetical protein